MLKNKRRAYSKSDRKNFLFVYLLILLPVLQFLIFWVYINFNSIVLAFYDKASQSYNFNNFIQVFNEFFHPTSVNIPEMMGRSVILWAVSNLIAFPIGLASTYVIYRRVWGHYAFRVIFSISGIVGAVVWVSLLKSVCSAGNTGIVIYILKNWFQMDNAAMSQNLFDVSETAFPTIVIIGFIQGIVGGSVITTGAYAKIPPELLEAAKLDGLDFWGSFIHVALPCSWPTISTLLTISLCGILTVEGNVFLYTGGNGLPGLNTMGYYLYSLSVNISRNPVHANYGYASAVGLTISLCSIPIVLIGRTIINKVIPTVEL